MAWAPPDGKAILWFDDGPTECDDETLKFAMYGSREGLFEIEFPKFKKLVIDAMDEPFPLAPCGTESGIPTTAQIAAGMQGVKEADMIATGKRLDQAEAKRMGFPPYLRVRR